MTQLTFSEQRAAIEAAEKLGLLGVPLNKHGAVCLCNGFVSLLPQAELQPVQEPVAWLDDFGNAFPLAANKGAGSWRDEHKRNWKPLYTAPPDQTAEIERLRNLSACEACAEIPSVMEYFKQCEERIVTLEAEIERLREELKEAKQNENK